MDPRMPAADATHAADAMASVKGDAAWLRWVALLNVALMVISVMRLGSVAAFENLPAPDKAHVADMAIAFAQFPAMAWLLMRLFKLGLDVSGFRRFPNIARHLLGVLVHAIMLALAVRVVFDQPLDTVVAASGVITFVLGFALRSLVADLFSGIALSVDRDIGVDDIVEFSLRNRHVIGQIVEFNWRTFKIRDLNNQVMMIPNSEFSSLMVINHSRSKMGCPCTVRFPLPARCDGDKALRVLRGALNREVHEGRIAADPAPHVEIAAAAQGSLAFEAHFLPRSPHTEHRVVGSLYEAGLRDLRLAGMSLAGPGESGGGSSSGAGSAAAAASATNVAATHDATQVISPQVQALGRVSLLSVLSEAQRNQLLPFMLRHEEPEGTVIVDEGEAGSSMFFILEGACDVKVRASTGDWSHVAQLWPGDHFGEMSLLTGHPRSARVSMTTEGVLLELPKEALSELFTSAPELLAKVSASMLSRTEQSDAVRRRSDPQAQKDHATRVEALVLQMRRFFGLLRH